MALIFTDGMDAYSSASDILKKWSIVESPWTVNSTGGVNGGNCLRCATTGGKKLRTPSNVNLNWVFNSNYGAVQFYIKVSAPPSSTVNLLNLVTTTQLVNNFIRLNTSGQLALYSFGPTLMATGTMNICDNAWHFVEMQLGPTNGAGNQKCFVDYSGNTQWNGSFGLNTQADVSQLEFESLASLTLDIDDIQIINSTGSTYLPSVIPTGPLQIKTLWPDGDDAVQFTRSAGATNASCVDETVPDMTDYVESGTSGQQDTYTFGNLGFTPLSVKLVNLNAYLSNPFLGSINHQLVAKSSATTTAAVSTTTPISPMILQQPFHTDPNGNITWTGSAIDAAKFGIKIP